MQIKDIVITVCCLFMFSGVMATEKTPVSYAAFFKKGMEKTEGVLPVYRQEEKYYLEIPEHLLGRDFLFLAQVTKGSGGSGMFVKSLGMASFRKFQGHKLALFQDIHSERLADSVADLEHTFLQPVESLYPIVAYGADQKSPIIEVTTLVKNGKEWFTLPNFAAGAEAGMSRINGVERILDGVRFSVMRMHHYGAKARPGQKGYVLSEIEFTLRVLPQEKMQVRLADPRVGYQTADYSEYDLVSGAVRRVAVIRRWHIEKGPLVFTFSPDIPDWARLAIKKGITGWQQAFAAAGIPDALQIQEAGSTEGLSQARILVTFSTSGNTVTSSMVTDPRTGEILTARLNVAHSTPAALLRDYLFECGATDPRIWADPHHPDIVSELVGWKVAHEIGNILGLAENRAGSAAYTTKQLRDKKWLADHGCTASVMDDCCLNYVAQPGDGIDIQGLVPRVGEYDRWAICYGYTPLTGSPQEVKGVLKPLLAEASGNPALRYMPTEKNNPYTQRKDLAADKVNAARYGMKNLERLIPELERLTAVADGEGRKMLKLAWLKVGETYKQYLNDAASLIGGQMQMPVIRGYNEMPVVYVPKREQQEAMKFLEEYLFSEIPAWLDYSPAEEYGWLTGTDVLKTAAKNVLSGFFKQDKQNLLIEAERAGGKENYGVRDLYGDLDRMIYAHFDGTLSGRFPRMMQHLYTTNRMGAALTGEVNALQNDYALVNLAEMVRFRRNLEHLSRTHTGIAERNLYRMMLASIDRVIRMDGKAVKEALQSILK